MEKLTNIELETVSIHTPSSHSLVKIQPVGEYQEDDIETGSRGVLHVTVHGNRKKAPILTYHDIGLNSTSCFQAFFNYGDMQQILKHFCVYHINAPGQQEDATPLFNGIRHSESEKLLQELTIPGKAFQKRASLAGTASTFNNAAEGYTYPTMDELSEMIIAVMNFYSLKSFIGFGVGAGANILSRFALNHPDMVEGLVLINCTAKQAGWMEWGYQKWNVWSLKSGELTPAVEEYLLWHWFGQKTIGNNLDLVMAYQKYMQTINPYNLALFIESYIRRTDLAMERAADDTKRGTTRNFKCPVMIVSGDYSPHLDDSVEMNGRADPNVTCFIKYECGGLVHEEIPWKLSESFLFYLQGLGHAPCLRLKVDPKMGIMSSPRYTPPIKETLVKEKEMDVPVVAV